MLQSGLGAGSAVTKTILRREIYVAQPYAQPDRPDGRRVSYTLGITIIVPMILLETHLMLSLEFLITSFIVVLIPGTGVVFTVSTGLVQGRKASVFAALGCTAGIVPHLLATVLGLAAIMHTSALAFQALKYAGVAYLFYIAIATWRDNSAFAIDGTASTTTAAKSPLS